MNNFIQKYISLFLVAFPLSGCSNNKHFQTLATGWSDNSMQIVVLERSYNKEQGFLNSKISNVDYKISIIDRDLNVVSHLVHNLNGTTQVNRLFEYEIFYKSNNSYVLVRTDQSEKKEFSSSVDQIRSDYTLLDLEGNIVRVFGKSNSYCTQEGIGFPPFKAAPSPNGDLIATAEVNEDCEIHLKFYDVNTEFAEIGSISIPGIEFTGFFWVDDSNIIINSCSSSACFENEFVGVSFQVSEITQKPIDSKTINSLCLESVIVNPSINQNEEHVFIDDKEQLKIETVLQYEFDHLKRVFRRDVRNLDNPPDCIHASDFISSN